MSALVVLVLPRGAAAALEAGIRTDNEDTSSAQLRLIAALRRGDVLGVRQCLAEGASANVTTAGVLPLCAAVNAHSQECLELLLAAGANADTTDERGHTPLHVSIMNADVACTHSLLVAGVPINAIDLYGRSALHYACMAKVLPAMGMADSSGLANRYLDNVALLIQFEADIVRTDHDGISPIVYAAQSGLSEMVAYLLDAGAEIDSATSDGQLAGRTPLMFAARNGDWRMVELLLKNGADVSACDAEGNSALSHACMNGDEHIIDVLCKAGAAIESPNARGESAIMQLAVCQRATSRSFEAILKYGARVDGEDRLGRTPLLHCANRGDLQSVLVLLQNGANSQARSASAESALTMAAGCFDLPGRLMCMEATLLQVQNIDGYMQQSMLESLEGQKSAIRNGEVICEQLLRALVAAGTDINARNAKGRTALMICARQGSPNCVVELLEMGANPYLADHEGRCAVDLAAERRDAYASSIVAALITRRVDE